MLSQKICIPVVIILIYILYIIYQILNEECLKKRKVEEFGASGTVEASDSAMMNVLTNPKIIIGLIIFFLLCVVLPIWLFIRKLRQKFGAVKKLAGAAKDVATGEATFSTINAAANSTMHLR